MDASSRKSSKRPDGPDASEEVPEVRGDDAVESQPPEALSVPSKSVRRLALDAAFRDGAELRSGLTENLSQARTRNDALDVRVERAFQKFSAAAPATGGPTSGRNRVEPGTTPFKVLDRVM